MFASVLRLSRNDLNVLKITDEYSIHRVVYSLFEDMRTAEEKKASVSSGFLYVDRGGDFNKREILIISDRRPTETGVGHIDTKPIHEAFFSHHCYQFEIVVNPTKRDSKTGKLIAICTKEEIKEWFSKKAASTCGFTIVSENFVVHDMWVNQFQKSNHQVVQSGAKLSGVLLVHDQHLFRESFKKGIGRGKAFGFGLLQITPLVTK